MEDNEQKTYSLFSLKEEESRKQKIKSFMEKNKVLSLFLQFPVTMIIISINVLMALIAGILSRNLLNFSSITLYNLGAMQTGAIILKKEFFRFFTSSILHGGIIHLAFNMYALFFLGQTVEKLQGKTRFAIVYLFSSLVAASFTFMSGFSGIGIGASGSVFAIFGYFFVILAEKVFKKQLPASILIRFSLLLVVNIAIGISVEHIDNAAHVGGFIAGVFSGLFFYLVDKTDIKWFKKISPYIVALLFITAPIFAVNNASKDETFPVYDFEIVIKYQEASSNIINFINGDYSSFNIEDNIKVGEEYIRIVENYQHFANEKVQRYLVLLREAILVQNEIIRHGNNPELDNQRSSIIYKINNLD